jgi:predicted TIM-barrel fold metal-dependent hydrolase
MTSLTASVRVDCHFHVFEAGQAVTGARYVPAYRATIESWAKQADGVGVSHGVLVQPSFLGVDNRKLLSTLAAHRDKLKGVVVVSPAISRSELLAMHVAGVRGVRLNFSGRDHDLQAWAQQRTFWDDVLSLGWHVQVHTDPGRLPDVLPSLPSGLHVVVDHMGRPLNCRVSDPTLSLLRRLGPDRVSVKLSGAYRLGRVKPQALAQSLLAELGPEALLWGSDWPCTNFETWADYPALYASLSQWLGDQHVELVLCANPLRLYWGTGPDA